MKHIFKHGLSLLMGIFISSNFAYSQTYNTPSSDQKMTPNQSGGSIGNISSPNLYDGSANINIPIFNYPTETGDWGISLGYNTKGIKVDELPSAAGLHWNIQAGGSITRTLKDLPDEGYSPQVPPLNDSGTAKGKWVDNGGIDLHYMDKEYDDFTVSAGSLSFTFNLSKDGFLFSHPRRDVKIELFDGVFQGLPVTTKEVYPDFKITDEQGNQFWFEKGEQSKLLIEGMVSFEYTTKWNLKKLVLANGNVIQFFYSSIDHKEVSYNNFYDLENKKGDYHPNNTVFHVDFNPMELNYQNRLSRLDSIHYPDNKKLYLNYNEHNEIPCAIAGTVLLYIKIESGGNFLLYKMEQAYSLANGPNVSLPEECPLSQLCQQQTNSGLSEEEFKLYRRLILKGITIQPSQGVAEPYYTFEYDDTARLPFRLYGSQDYFGYYNARHSIGLPIQYCEDFNHKVTIPYHKLFYPLNGSYDYYGVNKDEGFKYAKTGILKKIKNAYGGSVTYEYEEHQLSNVLTGLPNDDLFLGVNANDGIRLKSTVEQDEFRPNEYKKTEYNYDGGQRFLTGGYFHAPYNVPQGGSYVSRYIMFGIYMSPHQLVNGSNHGYSNVTITNTNQDNQLLSKKKITLSNLKDATSNNQPRYLLVGGSKNYYELPYTDKQYIKDWELGLPLSIKEYDQNNKILTETTHLYDFQLDTSSTIGHIENVHEFKVIGPLNKSVAYATDTYRPYTGAALKVKTTIKKYVSDNLFVRDIIDYQYDDKLNLKNVITKDSRKQRTMLRNIYNYDVSGPSVQYGSMPGIIYNMTVANLEIPVSMERWEIDANNKLLNLIDANITLYDFQNGLLQKKALFTSVLGKSVSFNDYTETVPNSICTTPHLRINAAYNNGQSTLPYFQKMSEVLQSDGKGNPLETQMLGQNQYQAMIWDTLTMNKLAIVGNAQYGDIAYTGFEKKLIGSYNGNSIIEEGNFSYQKMGITTTEFLTGVNSYFINSSSWGWVKTPKLKVGKKYVFSCWAKGGVPTLSGAGLSNIPLTALYIHTNGWIYYEAYFTPTQIGQVTISSTAQLFIDELRLFPEGAQMTSWTYEPLFGISSSTDPAGRITFYEYDKFGRVKRVKDQEGNILSEKTYHVH